MKTKIALAASRVNAGMTQEDIAQKLGISRSMINDWENGKREMKTVYFIAWCHVVGMSEDEIILPEATT